MKKPLDKPAAWACVWTNLLILPGLGSVFAGRKVGYPQAALALAGFTLAAVFAWWFVKEVFRLEGLPSEFGRHGRIGLAGLAVFLAAWLWALTTSLSILKEIRTRPPVLPKRN